MSKTGLVLEGGGMRGLFTAGVIDIFMDHGFLPDVICGTSAGVTFGVNLPSRQRGRVLRYNLKYVGRRDYISVYSLLTTGNMINVPFAYDKLPRELDVFDEKAFEESGVEFYATVTNVDSGLPEYMRITNCDRQMDVIRATASLPFISTKVYIDGTPYLDGGITDNIPLDKCIECGCDKIIVVLTHTEGFVRNDNLLPATRLLYPFDKNLIEAMRHRNERYNATMAKLLAMEDRGEIVVIRPSRKVDISRLEKDPERIKEMYSLGLEDAAEKWDVISSYLAR